MSAQPHRTDLSPVLTALAIAHIALAGVEQVLEQAPPVRGFRDSS